jgi:hypothetical protein
MHKQAESIKAADTFKRINSQLIHRTDVRRNCVQEENQRLQQKRKHCASFPRQWDLEKSADAEGIVDS